VTLFASLWPTAFYFLRIILPIILLEKLFRQGRSLARGK
jgi:hypothetical protein